MQWRRGLPAREPKQGLLYLCSGNKDFIIKSPLHKCFMRKEIDFNTGLKDT